MTNFNKLMENELLTTKEFILESNDQGSKDLTQFLINQAWSFDDEGIDILDAYGVDIDDPQSLSKATAIQIYNELVKLFAKTRRSNGNELEKGDIKVAKQAMIK